MEKLFIFLIKSTKKSKRKVYFLFCEIKKRKKIRYIFSVFLYKTFLYFRFLKANNHNFSCDFVFFLPRYKKKEQQLYFWKRFSAITELKGKIENAFSEKTFEQLEEIK